MYGDFFLPTWRVRGGSLISRMNDYNNDDFPEKSARQTAAYRLGYVSVRRLQTKVSEYGGTGKDFTKSINQHCQGTNLYN